MAKMMLSRSNMTALCAYTTRLFRCNVLHHYQPPPRASFLILPVATKFGAIKPLIGRRSITAGVTNGTGPIDSPLMQSMETKIKEELNAELVTVKDAYGDGRHVSIDVVSADFEGKSAVNRQRMVYKAIWEELQSVVHAVDQMTTRTPEEAAASGK
ncbi:protein BOLA4, chloroplastic/mitochondrial-like [Bidens hawaiensis]|uniref:protein BOLA4, chloroplastic/mitochondrial-like n=1 Tax=Bidens hawaiensis TaxID=980011 RepID=UPI0040496F32